MGYSRPDLEIIAAALLRKDLRPEDAQESSGMRVVRALCRLQGSLLEQHAKLAAVAGGLPVAHLEVSQGRRDVTCKI